MIKVHSKERVTNHYGTLRGHTAAISAVEVFYVPSMFTASLATGNDQLFEPTLISSDESGWIIWWDITIKRPLAVWKAHEGNILTVKQVGLDWTEANTASIDEKWFGKLLTHGKDGDLKVWDLFQVSKDAYYSYRPSSLLNKKVHVEGDDVTQWKTPRLPFEMPINVMNFANVDINNGVLLAPGTQDSAKIDIYRIDIETSNLTRLFKAVCPMEIAEQNRIDLNVQAIPDSEVRGLGIVMKLVWIADNKFAAGYESGHVIIFQIQAESIDIVQYDVQHYPNPILSLYYDATNEKLISTSSSDKIVIQTTDSSKLFHVNHKGVADVKTRNDLVGLVTWDGYARFYNYDDQTTLKFKFKLSKMVPSISATNSSTDIAENASNIQGQRVGVLAFSKSQPFHERSELAYINGSAKNLVRRRDEMKLTSNWLFLGYKDGKVAVYTTNNA
ncbi:hypothetical protein OGAPHI_003612 [Ogataea philodendri]|uniref:ASTRA-associated protein 1 n=1 Tax=Ogataea philodendri TaxID=1378263 RepID=A0A9P8P4K0_9ASCO|nr:uncharacterized protein OGAPHI_003612 [Ogataea philodendri]KAH3665428.1 hypothetical protein OGAPHI_003612 [Ogataea philodendri]